VSMECFFIWASNGFVCSLVESLQMGFKEPFVCGVFFVWALNGFVCSLVECL
jgi:hypothetical protein